jgi:hypothetical protein
MTLPGLNAPSRRGIHESTVRHVCRDQRDGAGSSPRWVRHLRRGRCAAASPCGTGWSMSRRLLARTCRAGLLDTTGQARSVWRMSPGLSPGATRGLVLGRLRWLSALSENIARARTAPEQKTECSLLRSEDSNRCRKNSLREIVGARSRMAASAICPSCQSVAGSSLAASGKSVALLRVSRPIKEGRIAIATPDSLRGDCVVPPHL